MKKKILIFLYFFICICCTICAVFILPKISDRSVKAEYTNSSSLLPQKILSYSSSPHTYYKVYASGKLVGVVCDLEGLNSKVDQIGAHYEEEYGLREYGICDDVVIEPETSFMEFENIDDRIVTYLHDHDLLGVSSIEIDFSTEEGIYDIIYVSSIDDFYEARNDFLENFIAEESLQKLKDGESVGRPQIFGSVETGLSIQEKMSYSQAFVSPEKVFTSVKEIYDYFCYGRNEERQYYTMREGDTLQGVGFYFGDMSPKQLMMLNRDVILDENQILPPGTVLNVAYYTSPITVSVTKQRLAEEVVIPENPEYREDNTLVSGATKVLVQETNGLKNVLYEEVWINGVLKSGVAKEEEITLAPVRGVIALGTMRMPDVGTGNFMWPVDSPKITCNWACYPGHTGTDIVSQTNKTGNIYAADTGVIVKVSYDSISGNYIVIDHNNGIQSYYGHCNATYVEVGQTVQRGEVIGQIGRTGLATGNHVHFHFIVDGHITEVCNYMDCGSIPGGRK